MSDSQRLWFLCQSDLYVFRLIDKDPSSQNAALFKIKLKESDRLCMVVELSMQYCGHIL